MNPSVADTARAWLADHQADPAAVRAWAASVLAIADHHGPIPHLGDPGWQALPDTDPRKLAAAVLAALAWLTENTTTAITERLQRELADADRAAVAKVRRMSHDLSAAIRDANHDRHGNRITRPSHAELTRRRLTFPCLTCGTADVLHPQTICDTCQNTRTTGPTTGPTTDTTADTADQHQPQEVAAA